MRLIIFLALGLGLVLGACGTDELPECIDDKLRSFRNEACGTTPDQDGGNLVSFRFKAQTVYCFNWGFCDPSKTVEIYTEDCTLLCEMGGIDGVTICDNVEWATNATEQRVFFQN